MSKVLRNKLLHQHGFIAGTLECVCRSLVDVGFYSVPLFLELVSHGLAETKRSTYLHHRVNIKNEWSAAKVHS
jgi:hypothetical protein